MSRLESKQAFCTCDSLYTEALLLSAFGYTHALFQPPTFTCESDIGILSIHSISVCLFSCNVCEK